VTGCCEHGNEPSCSIKGGEFFDKLSDFKVLKNGFSPWSQLIYSFTYQDYQTYFILSIKFLRKLIRFLHIDQVNKIK
jgi:hypothetical protein